METVTRIELAVRCNHSSGNLIHREGYAVVNALSRVSTQEFVSLLQPRFIAWSGGVCLLDATRALAGRHGLSCGCFLVGLT